MFAESYPMLDPSAGLNAPIFGQLEPILQHAPQLE